MSGITNARLADDYHMGKGLGGRGLLFPYRCLSAHPSTSRPLPSGLCIPRTHPEPSPKLPSGLTSPPPPPAQNGTRVLAGETDQAAPWRPNSIYACMTVYTHTHVCAEPHDSTLWGVGVMSPAAPRGLHKVILAFLMSAARLPYMLQISGIYRESLDWLVS